MFEKLVSPMAKGGSMRLDGADQKKKKCLGAALRKGIRLPEVRGSLLMGWPGRRR